MVKSERFKDLNKYQKYNTILGITIFIYPIIKSIFDRILESPGIMKFFPGLIIIALSGLVVGATQWDKQCKPFSKKIFIVLFILLIFEIILSLFREMPYE